LGGREKTGKRFFEPLSSRLPKTWLKSLFPGGGFERSNFFFLCDEDVGHAEWDEGSSFAAPVLGLIREAEVDKRDGIAVMAAIVFPPPGKEPLLGDVAADEDASCFKKGGERRLEIGDGGEGFWIGMGRLQGGVDRGKEVLGGVENFAVSVESGSWQVGLREKEEGLLQKEGVVADRGVVAEVGVRSIEKRVDGGKFGYAEEIVPLLFNEREAVEKSWVARF
jgi:hypothetical protein